MSRRFVIVASNLTNSQETQLQQYLGAHGGWWHWIGNFWLFKTNEGVEISAAEMRDYIIQMSTAGRVFVMEVDEISWAGFGPKGENKSMFKWLRESWPDPGQSDGQPK